MFVLQTEVPHWTQVLAKRQWLLKVICTYVYAKKNKNICILKVPYVIKHDSYPFIKKEVFGNTNERLSHNRRLRGILISTFPIGHSKWETLYVSTIYSLYLPYLLYTCYSLSYNNKL